MTTQVKDLFSDRFHTESDVVLVQHYLALENLMRSANGQGQKVHNVRYMFSPIKDSYPFNDIPDLINKVTERLNIDFLINGKKNNTLTRVVGINESMVFFANFIAVFNSGAGTDAYYDNFDMEDNYYNSTVNLEELVGIEMTISYIDELKEDVIKILFDNGFKIVENWQDRNVKRGETLVHYAFPATHGVQIRKSSFEIMRFDSIKENYDESVQRKYQDTLNVIDKSNKGLVIINGPPGTGKSYLLRALLSDVKNRSGIICTPPTEFLHNLSKINEVLSQYRRSFVIFEDVGDILTVDANSKGYMNVITNLLNQTDGLLSLMSDTIFILSFNHDIDKINEALLRPGRCLSRIEVNLLPYEKAQELVGFPILKQDYSLAEIYAMINAQKPLFENTKRKSPFRL